MAFRLINRRQYQQLSELSPFSRAKVLEAYQKLDKERHDMANMDEAFGQMINFAITIGDEESKKTLYNQILASRFLYLSIERELLFLIAGEKSDLEILTELFRQSKLSQEELNQLQKDTHFDKKELQQWYKGKSGRIPFAASDNDSDPLQRLPQRLSLRHAHERGISKDLQTILPLRRPYIIRRLRLQCLRLGQVRLD